MAMLPNNIRICVMQDLIVHIDLEHNFYQDSYESELAEFMLISKSGDLIELPELIE